MKAPLTDRTLGIPHHFDSSMDRFKDFRKKAKDEEVALKKKSKRDKKVRVPKYEIGQDVVLATGSGKRHYHLAEVVDWDEERWGGFTYFGILKKTTDQRKVNRLGRLLIFSERSWWSSGYSPANVEDKGIKWESVWEV
jgi:hypothetical protein